MTSKKLAHSSGHDTVSGKYSQVNTVNERHVSIFTSGLLTTDRNILKPVLLDPLSTRSEHNGSTAARLAVSDSLL